MRRVILMQNAARAYLKTEGAVDYRDCKICYYTYSMFEVPEIFKVNVNIILQNVGNNFTKTLPLDNSFTEEKAAIDYGITQGKNFIDRSYELGKIKIIKPQTENKASSTKAAKNKERKK